MERTLHSFVREENLTMANPTQPNQNQPRGTQQGQPQQAQGQPQGTQAQPPQEQQRPGLQRMRREMPVTGMIPMPFMLGPFALMRRLFDDLAQLAGVGEPVSEPERLPGGMFIPQIDVQQRDDNLVVHVDLPGTAPADVQLRIEDNTLIVEGDRRVERELEEGGIVRTERVFGRFQRVIPLPEGADPESAEARFANGVLEVTIKTPQRQKGRRIEIQSGGEQARERAGERQGTKDTAKH
jgi:HSP20 family protein